MVGPLVVHSRVVTTQEYYSIQWRFSGFQLSYRYCVPANINEITNLDANLSTIATIQ